jgi:predicted dithiol-disulfide oxidoreductase (DUF899 family)
MAHPKIVSQNKWLIARKKLLAKEKKVMHQQDALAAARRRLPMVAIDKPYIFETENGKKASLLDLFDGRRQLLIYHFMFDPNDPPPGKTEPFTEGCPGCSFMADNMPHISHLNARDTTLVLVSRAPQKKIKPFKKRMGWMIPWYSSFGSDFNYDFQVTTDEAVAPVVYNYKNLATLKREKLTYHIKGEQPGLSAFLCIDGRPFHTYSTYGRGLDQVITTHHLLDLTAYGRMQDWEDSPPGWPKPAGAKGLGVKHHDKYGDLTKGSCDCSE